MNPAATTRRRWLLLALAAILPAGFLFVYRAPVDAQPASTPVNASTPTPIATPVVAPAARLVRVEFSDQAAVDRLGARYDVWEVHFAETPGAGGWALLQVDDTDIARLHIEGYDPRPVDPVEAADLQGRSCGGGPTIADFPCYRSVVDTYADLAALAVRKPSLASWISIGDSWEKASPGGGAGNDLRVLVVTNQKSSLPKFRFFLMGAIHARELATAETATRFAELLVDGYGVDADITWLLDHGEAHILAQANPDGRQRAEEGYCWRKNTNDSVGACAIGFGNGPGIDLNRNFAFNWGVCGAEGCSSDYACSAVYRGIAPASEPEVDAVQNYLSSIFPDHRAEPLAEAAPPDTAGLAISLHSYGELVLFPWGFTNTPSPNGAQLQVLADKMGYYTGYRACGAGADGCLYKTDGTTDDWLYGERGTAAFTIEMGTSFFQSCSTYESEMVDDLLATLLYAFKAARRPYQTPAGPEPVNVALSSNVVVRGSPLTLTATLDTTRFDDNGGRKPGDSITPTTVLSATWYLDTPSWVTGRVAFPMKPLDGAFDNAIETVHAAIDTSSLSIGRHLVLVEGKNNSGQTGVPSAVFVDVVTTLPPAPTPPARLYVPGVKNNGN